MMKKIIYTVLTACLFYCQLTAQVNTVTSIRNYLQANQHKMMDEFVSFLEIPNISNDSADISRNANFIMQAMNKRNIKNVQLLYPVTSKAFPAVYGEVLVPGATQTLIFYAHYDGQPVIASQWATGLQPFKPALYSASLEQNGVAINFPSAAKPYDPQWRIYARGASDDKAGVMAILNAYEAIVKTGGQPTVNIKFFFESEEETGSVHLFEILEQHKTLLQSDCWIICDGPVHQSGLKQVLFGARGDTHLAVTVYGPRRPLHSGHYGNWAPNPGMMLVELLASMKDSTGRVTIKGFYDDVTPLSAAEQQAIKEMPQVDEQMKQELGFIQPEMPGISLAAAINIPTLNINGIQSGGVGKNASNVIPIKAEAVIDLRLVVGTDWQKQQQKVVSHIREQGYYITSAEPTNEERSKYPRLAQVSLGGGYNAQKTSMDLPITKKIVTAVQTTTSEKIVLTPTMGGSLPLFVFEKYLQANTIAVPLANHDNNQHAENENIRLKNFWDGIETMAALMRLR